MRGRSVVDSMLQHATSPEAAPVQPTVNRPRTRLQDNIVQLKVYSDRTMQYEHQGLRVVHEPQTLHEALSDAHWKEGMDDEFVALVRKRRDTLFQQVKHRMLWIVSGFTR
jgi:hypothetical protein